MTGFSEKSDMGRQQASKRVFYLRNLSYIRKAADSEIIKC